MYEVQNSMHNIDKLCPICTHTVRNNMNIRLYTVCGRNFIGAPAFILNKKQVCNLDCSTV